MQPRSQRRSEVEQKLTQLRVMLAEQQLDAVVLDRNANLSWVTAGANMFVNTAATNGESSIVVTAESALVVTNPIEAPRLQREEALDQLGFSFIVDPWYATKTSMARLLRGKRVSADTMARRGKLVESALLALRTVLQPEEVVRLRQFSSEATCALESAMLAIQPGMTESDVAALVDAASRRQGGQAIVNLVAADDRVSRFRHPLPTLLEVQRYVMAVLCYRREGLVASVTRLVHFGPLPADLRAKAEAVARVDARIILGTTPGRTMADCFQIARQAYQDEGYPEAIEEHHQGGSTGYQTREVVAKPGNLTPILLNQAFAWNPSIRGTKSEDTVLLTENGPEVLTGMPDWPVWMVEIDGKTIARPAIMER